jgi:hypothetical protein
MLLSMTLTTTRLSQLFFLTLLLLTACVPGTKTMTEITGSPESQQLERTAQLAYLKMEEAKLETGVYQTDVLLEVALPQGVLWQLEALTNDTYQLRFISNDVPGFAYIVNPEGVTLIPSS